jgi:hypothetical protein
MADVWHDVNAYAALEAQVALFPEKAADLLSDRGLDGIKLMRLRMDWNAQFAGDPVIEDNFAGALEDQRVQLAPKPPPPPPVTPECYRPPEGPSSAVSPWALHGRRSSPSLPAYPTPDAGFVATPYVPPPTAHEHIGTGTVMESEEFQQAVSAALKGRSPLPFTQAEPSVGAATSLLPSNAPAVGGDTTDDLAAIVAETLRKGPALPAQWSQPSPARPSPPSIAVPVVRLPPPPAPPPPPPELTLQQHASFWVELELNPAQRPAILARYHLTEAALHAAETYWRPRLQSDPAAWATWQQTQAAYRAWLAEQQAGRR